ncbi:MAG: NADH:flavin oxidoreductase [Acidobacteria bacterium]|nr:NADH:flavin oxidoreductase [Acidobacteriota bacterium]
MSDVIFEPLAFRNLTVKNRIFRSNISGRFDNYDGSGTQTRINWEMKFARGGVGAIISSFVPVQIRGRILINYATIHEDSRIPFWRALGEEVHSQDCKFILQLSHGGRQRDLAGFEYPKGHSSTDRPESLNGFECDRMSKDDIAETVAAFAQGARRAKAAGLDGVELHSANGYLFTQFLSSAINDRDDEYGGSLPNRARFLIEVIRAIRAEVGPGFHLQMKISATEYNNALAPWEPAGNSIEDSMEVCKMAEQEGVDAIHVSGGSTFPHPKNPPGDFPMGEYAKYYDAMISSGTRVLQNYLLFREGIGAKLFHSSWIRARGDVIEGINLPDAQKIKQAVSIPVICTGGFQTASVIRGAITGGKCDAVSIARPLVANNDLVQQFAAGADRPAVPCTYCNRCLLNVLENPLGCYEESRFPSRDEMIRQILSVYQPAPFE